jgi:hypothetical protein
LTYEVEDPRSPVCVWLRSRFPGHKDVQARFRADSGPALVLPSGEVATATQGAAIDWWIRFLADPGPQLGLALTGLLKERQAPCFSAGMMMLAGLRAIDRDLTLLPVNAARFQAENDEWQARVCYALALLTELCRASSFDGSRLMRLGPDSTARDLLTLANRAEVADLIALRDLARLHLLPALPAGPVASGAEFDGSEDLNADADLVAGGMLIDIKAGQGGKPRKDGTRIAVLSRTELDQLIGYALMDYTDEYQIHTVAIYAARFGYLVSWPLTELLTQLGGCPANLQTLRAEFAQVLRVELPHYWQSCDRQRS